MHFFVWLGQITSYIPYSIRPIVGVHYRNARAEIIRYKKLTEEEKKDYIFRKMESIVNYAYNEIPFYHRYYDEQGFSPSDLIDFDDLNKIPIINKDILLPYTLEDRCKLDVQHYVVNTGGSSGKTLTLCSQRHQMAIESAHCHEMYYSIGYKPIGQQNRGKLKGAPKIGSYVWIGVNSTIVGKVEIGDDVLIAPGAYVNCDVPSHSVVIGNPCQIHHKDNATEGYINNVIY